MADARNKFAQPDEDTPFGRHLKEVTRYLNIGIPSFTGTYNATLPEVYHNDLKDTIYQICGRRDEQWEMISTRKDRSIAAFI